MIAQVDAKLETGSNRLQAENQQMSDLMRRKDSCIAR